MPKSTVRVNIPTKPTDQIALLGKVVEKHNELAAQSPLSGLEWSKINPALTDAKKHDDAATLLGKQLEKEYGARSVSMPQVTKALRAARDVLLGTYQDNPKTLGDFGYVVDDSPQAKPATTPAKPTP